MKDANSSELSIEKDFLNSNPFRNRRILVMGDATVDRTVYGRVESISPDAPVPLLLYNYETASLGGIGRVIGMLDLLESGIELVTLIGNDYEGEYYRNKITEMNIGTKGLFTSEISTPTITRFYSDNMQLLRVEKRYELSESIRPRLNRNIIDFLKGRITRIDVIIILDYGIGLFSADLIGAIIELARLNKVRVIVRPEAFRQDLYQNVDFIVMNVHEACKSVKVSPLNETGVRIAGINILNRTNADNVFLYRVDEPSYFFKRGGDVINIESALSEPIKNLFSIGASILSSLSLALASGYGMDECIRFSHKIATINSIKMVESIEDLRDGLRNFESEGS